MWLELFWSKFLPVVLQFRLIVCIQIQNRVQMTVQMHSIKDAITYVLQKAHYKDARERQQQVILAYCWLSLFLGDLSFIVQKN